MSEQMVTVYEAWERVNGIACFVGRFVLRDDGTRYWLPDNRPTADDVPDGPKP